MSEDKEFDYVLQEGPHAEMCRLYKVYPDNTFSWWNNGKWISLSKEYVFDWSRKGSGRAFWNKKITKAEAFIIML